MSIITEACTQILIWGGAIHAHGLTETAANSHVLSMEQVNASCCVAYSVADIQCLVCRGKYYAMNVPLKDGIDDQSYAALFKPVMSKLIEVYQPTAVVFQSGNL